MIHQLSKTAQSVWWAWMLLGSLLLFASEAVAQVTNKDYRLADLEACSLTSLEMSRLGPNNELEPCIIYDEQPKNPSGNDTSVIPIVQVTPSGCHNHRDGAPLGVQYINRDNDGKGVFIGFEGKSNHHVQFRLISVVAGIPASLGGEEYNRRHIQLLSDMLETTGSPYIVGTCSFASAIERQPAKDYKAMVLAQVGPPGFYKPPASNEWVFGIHINSDTYPLPNVQTLGFLAKEQGVAGPSKIPVRIIYRKQSEFFFSTCQSAIDRLTEQGFTNLNAILYDHTEDHDGDGEANQFDKEFLESLADGICPPEISANPEVDFRPAIFMCTLTEQDIILNRLLETGCRPISLWLTAATWGWANNNGNKVPYFQGGGQWHESFDYSDDYFESGVQLLDENESIQGYRGTYDQVVSYSVPALFAEHLKAAYRVTDSPNPVADFADEEGRERLRRAMLILNANTLFGPVAFDGNQRNVGRQPAGSQWLSLGTKSDGEDSGFVNALVSPFLQAEASSVVPSPSGTACDAGNFDNSTIRVESGSILSTGCMVCPEDTFLIDSSFAGECQACPTGSSTDGFVGSDYCIIYEDNLLSGGIIGFGYAAVVLTWFLAGLFLLWIYIHRMDPVVKVSQYEFLVLICLGTMISSSTVIALSVQAGTGEDVSRASAGCTAAPFLYAIGWVLQYSSLSAKTYRLFQTMMNTKNMKRSAVTAKQMAPIVVVCLIVDLVIVIAWSIHSPLVYERTEESRDIDEENGIITINTVGRCVASNGDFWKFSGPLLLFHVFLIVSTNVLLCNVRDIGDRYQEGKYVALASGLMLEILVVGIPVLVSVNDSADALFIVMTAIIALDDIAVLCFVFIPKILFQRKGLEEGVQFGESIMKNTHKKASVREYSRRESSRISQAMPIGVSSYSREESMRDSEFDDRDYTGSSAGASAMHDSFALRVSGGDSSKQGYWLPRGTESGVESIVEETEDDLAEEDSEGSKSATSGQGPRSSFTGLKRPSLLGGAGISTLSSEASNSGKSVEDFQQMITEQEKMMDMARKMMSEHQEMMNATADMMIQHAELKEQLKRANAEISNQSSKKLTVDAGEAVPKQEVSSPVSGENGHSPSYPAELVLNAAEEPDKQSTGKRISASTSQTAMTLMEEGSDSSNEATGSGQLDV